MFSQAISLLLSLATTFILSRHLGVERFGGLNYIFAFYYFFQVLNELGIDVSVVRESSRHLKQSEKILAVMRTFKIMTALFSMLLAIAVIYLANYPSGLRYPLLIYSIMLPLIALQLPNLVFNIRLNMKIPSILGITKGICIFVLLIALISGGLGMTGYVVALVLSEGIVTFLINFYASRITRIGWAIDWKVCSHILKSGIPILVTGLFVAIFNRADFIMLERMTDLHQVGLYASMYKVTSLMESFPLMAMTTIFPLLSRYVKEDPRRFWSLYKKSTLFFGSLAIPMAVLVCLGSEWLIHLLFGSGFMEAVPGLRIQIWATVFLYLAITGGNALISLGLERINLLFNAIAAVLNVTLNLYWIPRWGFRGASLATVSAYAFLFISITIAMILLGRKRLAQLNSQQDIEIPETK